MDAFKFIAKEHERMDRAFAKLADTSEDDAEQRESIFGGLKKDLEIHMKIEEAILYPMLKQQSETRGKAFEGIAEHDIGKNLLREMDSMPKGSEEWTAKLDVLKESMEHHNKEEEEELFPDAREILSQDEIDDLGRRLQVEKEKLNETVI